MDLDNECSLCWWRSSNVSDIASRQIRLHFFMKILPSSAGVIPQELWPCGSPDIVSCYVRLPTMAATQLCNHGWFSHKIIKVIATSVEIFGKFKSHGNQELFTHARIKNEMLNMSNILNKAAQGKIIRTKCVCKRGLFCPYRVAFWNSRFCSSISESDIPHAW